MKLFITGIGTDVGKTIASAIITQALEADYWKPVQAGEVDFGDKHKVQSLLKNKKSKIWDNSYVLQTPASPHYAAAVDGITIDLDQIKEPKTKNHLVIEGAGGILVPLNDKQLIIDLIKPDYQVVVVSRHYLGSINHSLLTIEALRARNLKIAGIIFSGDENPATESIILSTTGLKMLGRIEEEPYFDANVVSDYAEQFKSVLTEL
jgi:dethiobiotin synthetase